MLKNMHDRLQNYIPLLRWIDGYSTQYAIIDFIAGITVGLTVLPQALAYSTLAGLAPQYGLYSAFMGCIVYAVFGGCRELTIGPTALLALMTSRHTSLGGESGPHFAILLCGLSGIVQLLMACLNLGALVDLISLPVTVGFTSATALIIGTSQLKGLLGLHGGSSSGFLDTIFSVAVNLGNVRYGDMVLGFCSILLLLLLRKLKDVKLSPTNPTRFLRTLDMLMWLVSTSRNALILVVSSLAAYYAEKAGHMPFILTGAVRKGLPSFALPPTHTTVCAANGTLVEMGFTGMLSELGPSIALVPVIAVLGNVAISKAFGGSRIDASRELFALSVANIMGSFVSSFPVTGSFSRSAVNHASGVKTPIGGLYTSVLVLLSLGVLTPYFPYIPKAALSAVIISAVVFMIEYEVVRPLWRCSRRELLPGAVTFILSLTVSVEIGLLAGVSTDLAFLIHRTARPVLSIIKSMTPAGNEYVLIRPKHSLFYFPAIEWVRSGILKAVIQHGTIPMVLDCRNLNEFDFTVARGLGALHKELSALQVPFILLGPLPAVQAVLSGSLSTAIPEIATEHELDLQLPDSFGVELKEVSTPLLLANHSEHTDTLKATEKSK